MNVKTTVKAAIILSALALVLYGVSDAIDGAFGVKDSLLDKPWQMLALANGLALLFGISWPHLRGVKAGDRLVALVRREHEMMGSWMEGITATAMEAGRTGTRIRVQLADGSLGEGIVLAYAGMFSPATLRLVETEMRVPRLRAPGNTEF